MTSWTDRALIFDLVLSRRLFAKQRVSLVLNVFLVLVGSLSLALSAQYKVPIGPVPITLQSLVVMLIGSLYGWRLGAVTVITYWCEGIALGALFSGMPWFAYGSGFSYFITAPSAGFLWGFLPMVMIIGFLLNDFEWKKSLFKACGGLILGQGALYLFGLAFGYFLVLPYVEWMNSTDDLIAIFMLPYLFGDALKTGIAAILTVQMVRLAKFRE